MSIAIFSGLSRDRAPAPWLVGLGCFATALAVLQLAPAPTDLTLMWPSNALGIFAALVGGRRLRWWRVAAATVGTMLANAAAGAPPLAALGYGLANGAEIAVAVALLQSSGMARLPNGTLREMAIFTVVAGVVAPAVGAALGAFTATELGGGSFTDVFIIWYTCCALGALMIVPLCAILWQNAHVIKPRSRVRLADAVATGAAVAAISAFSFSIDGLQLMFLPLVALVVVTVRSGWLGVAGSIIIVAACATITMVLQVGAFQTIADAQTRSLFAQFYLAVSFLAVLMVAALLEQRRQLTRRLQVAEAQYRLLADNSADALVRLDPGGICLYVSPASGDLIGIRPDELEGRNLVDLIEPADRDPVVAAHLRVLRQPGLTEIVRYRVTHPALGSRWLETRTRAIHGDGDRALGAVSAIRDVTDTVLREQQLADEAGTDPLTGVANRRRFQAALSAQLRAAPSEVAVAMLDLDFFKAVNDRYGHAAGDAVLIAVADVCRRSVRASDIVARLGGEEFALLLSGADATLARQIGERIRQTIERSPISVAPGLEIGVTLSIGIAVSDGRATVESLMAMADLQLYAAKSAGRNLLRLAA